MSASSAASSEGACAAAAAAVVPPVAPSPSAVAAPSRSEVEKRHVVESAMLETRIKGLGRARPGAKPISAESAAATAATLRDELKARHAAEMVELEAALAALSVAGGSAAAAGGASPSGAAAEHGGAAASDDEGAAEEGEAKGGEAGVKVSRAARRKAAKAAAAEADAAAAALRARAHGASSGISAREAETRAIKEQLARSGLEIKPITSDGNCLFKAVSDQLAYLASRLSASAARAPPPSASAAPSSLADHFSLRQRTVEHMLAHPSAFAAFLISAEGAVAPPAAAVMGAHCARMAKIGEWGTELELNALARVLGTPIRVYQAGAPPQQYMPTEEGAGGGAREAEDDDLGSSTMLRLSFHRRLFISEDSHHYNSVVPAGTCKEAL